MRSSPDLRLVLFLALAAPLSAAASPLAAAKALYERSRNVEAQNAFTALLGADRRNPEIHYHLGMLALRRDEAKAAVPFFETAVELSPDRSEYHRRLGDALAVQAQRVNVLSGYGLARRSLRAYKTAVATDPSDIGSRWALLEYYKNAPAVVGGDTEQAHAQADAIARLDAPGGRWAHAIVFLSEQKSADALALFADALDASPPDYTALVRFGFLSQWSGARLPDGLRALDTCLALPPVPGQPGHERVHHARGRILEQLRQPAAARAAYEAALAADPGFTPAIEALKTLR